MLSDSVNVLIVDDDDVDIAVLRRSFQKVGIKNRMIVAHDGIEALAILRGESGEPPLRQPVLILLDLNMPRMGGLAFLEQLRRDSALHRIIVFVLTTSNDLRDRDAAYDQHIAGYLVKSSLRKDLADKMPMLENFLQYVEFPRQPSGENIAATAAAGTP